MAIKPDSSALRSGIAVAAIAALGTAALALTNNVTREVIVKREDEEKMVIVNQLLPQQTYDNRLLRDTIKIAENEVLGTRETTVAYRARLKGTPSAALFEAIAPNGYGGRIRFMIAVKADGEISGVRVLNHNETPGWGDYIEISKGKWIKNFDGKSLTDSSDQEWQVRKDGGRFDYVTRATVSARAMVGGVHSALKYYAAHKNELFGNEGMVE